MSVSSIDGYKIVFSKQNQKEIERFGFKMHTHNDECQINFIAWEDDAKRLGTLKLSPGDVSSIFS